MLTKFPAVLSKILIPIIASIFIAACGGEDVTATHVPVSADVAQDSEYARELPIWRYVNSGWVTPLGEESADAFSRDLRVAVITNDSEMLNFNREVVSKRTNGTGATLSRPKFPGSVVLVAYLLWLPVQGDPLSVIGMKVEGNLVEVVLELEEDAQGRELPYLYAPMTMVTVDRSDLPLNGTVDFEFKLDGETLATVSDTLR